jgi:hypothetical protein
MEQLFHSHSHEPPSYFDAAPISFSPLARSHALVRNSGGSMRSRSVLYLYFFQGVRSKAPRRSSNDVDVDDATRLDMTVFYSRHYLVQFPRRRVARVSHFLHLSERGNLVRIESITIWVMDMDMDIETGRWAIWDGLPLYGIGSTAHRFAILASMTLSSPFTPLTRP